MTSAQPTGLPDVIVAFIAAIAKRRVAGDWAHTKTNTTAESNTLTDLSESQLEGDQVEQELDLNQRLEAVLTEVQTAEPDLYRRAMNDEIAPTVTADAQKEDAANVLCNTLDAAAKTIAAVADDAAEHDVSVLESFVAHLDGANDASGDTEGDQTTATSAILPAVSEPLQPVKDSAPANDAPDAVLSQTDTSADSSIVDAGESVETPEPQQTAAATGDASSDSNVDTAVSDSIAAVDQLLAMGDADDLPSNAEAEAASEQETVATHPANESATAQVADEQVDSMDSLAEQMLAGVAGAINTDTDAAIEAAQKAEAEALTKPVETTPAAPPPPGTGVAMSNDDLAAQLQSLLNPDAPEVALTATPAVTESQPNTTEQAATTENSSALSNDDLEAQLQSLLGGNATTPQDATPQPTAQTPPQQEAQATPSSEPAPQHGGASNTAPPVSPEETSSAQSPGATDSDSPDSAVETTNNDASEIGAAAAIAEQSTTDNAPEPQLADLDDMLAGKASEEIAEELAEPAFGGTFDVSDIGDENNAASSDEQSDEDSDDSEQQADSQDAAVGGDASETNEEESQRGLGRGRSLKKRLIAMVRDMATPQGAKQICILLNRPLANCSPQTRNLIGYIGLVTLFNAAAFLLYALI